MKKRLKTIKPNEKFEEEKTWKCPWNANEFDHIELDEVVVEYEDGTKQSITSPQKCNKGI